MKKFDIFKKPVQFRYKKENNFSTTIGFWISILIINAIVFFGLYFIKGLFFRQNPIINFQDGFLKEDPQELLSTDEFVFGIRVDLNNVNSSELKKYVNISAVYKYSNISKTLELDNCSNILSSSHHMKKYLNNTYLDQSICIKNQSTLSISRDLTSPEKSKTITIHVSLCVNSTENNYECYPEKTIENVIDKSSKFYINYEHSTFSIDDYKNPLLMDQDYYSNYLEFSRYKSIDWVLKKSDLHTDDGFIFEENNNIETILISDDFAYRDKKRDLTSAILTKIELQMSNKILTYRRKYIKFQEVIASTLGITKILLGLGDFIVKFFASKILEVDIVNTFFELTKKEKPDRVFSSTVKLINPTCTFRTEVDANENIPCNINKINQNLSNLTLIAEKYLEYKQKNKVRYKKCELLKSTLCPNKMLNEVLKKKEVLLRNLFDKINSQFDFTFLSKKYQELNFIKKFLFNKMQEMAFDSLPKPLDKKTFDLSPKEEIIELIYYYLRNKKSNNIGSIDEKILELLDFNLINHIENLSMS